MPDIITAAPLEGLPHGFLGRRGGVSGGAYASLNVGTGSEDDPALVEQNRRIAADAVLPGAALATVYQVHSALCERVIAPWPLAERPHADAMVTDRPGVLLGITTVALPPRRVTAMERAAP